VRAQVGVPVLGKWVWRSGRVIVNKLCRYKEFRKVS